jgi:hypothetical protein
MFSIKTCPKIKEHLGGFCYFLFKFCLKAFLFASLLSPSMFWELPCYFLLHPNGSFERFLGLGSLECFKALRVCWHVAFPIFSGGIRLISLKVIALVIYLGSWTLVTIVIVSKFLLEVIGVNSSRPFLFQAHMKSTQKLIPLGVVACVPLFEQLVERNTYCIQENISERLHNHLCINILFYLLFDLHQTHLRSCAGLSANVWLLIRLVIPFFHFPLDDLSTTIRSKLGLSHPLILGVSHCICNQPLDPMGIHFLRCMHGGERMASHDVVWDAFVAIAKDARFCESRPMSFHPLSYNLCIIELTLCYQSMVSTHW